MEKGTPRASEIRGMGGAKNKYLMAVKVAVLPHFDGKVNEEVGDGTERNRDLT